MQKISCTRQFESKFSLRSFALSLQKIKNKIMGLFGLFSNKKKETLDKGLEKTKESVFGKLARAVAGKSTVDDDVLDDLEEVLITSDVGVETTVKIIRRIEERVAINMFQPASSTAFCARKSPFSSLRITAMTWQTGNFLPTISLTLSS